MQRHPRKAAFRGSLRKYVDPNLGPFDIALSRYSASTRALAHPTQRNIRSPDPAAKNDDFLAMSLALPANGTLLL